MSKKKTKTAVTEVATKKAVESGITLAEAIPEFLVNLTELGKNVRTVEVYGRCLENVTTFFPSDKPLTKLTPMNIGQFLKSDALLKKPNGVDRSPITVAQIKRTLRMMLVWAVEKNYITDIPLPKSEMKGAAGSENKKIEVSEESDTKGVQEGA